MYEVDTHIEQSLGKGKILGTEGFFARGGKRKGGRVTQELAKRCHRVKRKGRASKARLFTKLCAAERKRGGQRKGENLILLGRHDATWGKGVHEKCNQRRETCAEGGSGQNDVILLGRGQSIASQSFLEEGRELNGNRFMSLVTTLATGSDKKGKNDVGSMGGAKKEHAL